MTDKTLRILADRAEELVGQMQIDIGDDGDRSAARERYYAAFAAAVREAVGRP